MRGHKHALRSSKGGMGGDSGLVDAEKYTERAFDALQRLPGIAEKFQQQFIEADLLFYSLLQDETAQRILSKAAGKGSFSSMMRQLAQSFEQYASSLPKVAGSSATMKQMGTSLRDVLREAATLQRQFGDDYVSVEHLLIATIASPQTKRTGLLDRFKISQEDVERATREVRGSQKVTSRNPEATTEALLKYGRDLTEEARAGRLDPVIGRDEEIRRTMQILSRRTKNNPILLGEPGVGKTAIVEGLAQRVASGDVPASLQVCVLSSSSGGGSSPPAGVCHFPLKQDVRQDVCALAVQRAWMCAGWPCSTPAAANTAAPLGRSFAWEQMRVRENVWE